MPDLVSPDCCRPRRILFFDHTAVLGGGEIALLRLIANLNRDRYEPVVVLGSDGNLRTRLAEHGVTTFVIPMKASIAHARKESLGVHSLLLFSQIASICRYILKIAQLIRNQQIDLVHTNSLKADLIGGLAARLAGVPCVWHIRDRIAPDYLPRQVVAAFRSLCQWLPNQVVANSCATRHTLMAPNRSAPKRRRLRRNIDRRNMDRTRVIYDGVDLPDQIFPSRNPSKVIAMVGRISPWKGQHIFVEAAAKVLTRHPDVCFHLVGSAMFGEQEYEVSLHRMVTSYRLESSLEFAGFHPDVAEYLKKVDILVHASVQAEPFGQVVIEGMAASRPVIATDGGAVPEIVVDGVTGILVPMDDPAAMAEAISRLIEQPAMGAEMGLAGYERVKQCFLIGRTAHQMQQLYDVMLGSETRAEVPSLCSTPDPKVLPYTAAGVIESGREL